jgi:PII-like signaling protein
VVAAAAAHPVQLWVLSQSFPVVVEVAAAAEVAEVVAAAVEAEVEALLRFQQIRVAQSGLAAFVHCLAPLDYV